MFLMGMATAQIIPPPKALPPAHSSIVRSVLLFFVGLDKHVDLELNSLLLSCLISRRIKMARLPVAMFNLLMLATFVQELYQ